MLIFHQYQFLQRFICNNLKGILSGFSGAASFRHKSPYKHFPLMRSHLCLALNTRQARVSPSFLRLSYPHLLKSVVATAKSLMPLTQFFFFDMKGAMDILGSKRSLHGDFFEFLHILGIIDEAPSFKWFVLHVTNVFISHTP